MRKSLRVIFALLIIILMFFNISDRAYACTLVYFGGAYTDDGSNLFLRVEDGNTSDENKPYMVSPAGMHKAGEEYLGCFGFKWTFTHDSYKYISRRDDNLIAPCPNCGSTHPHQPYEEAGTNEYGLTVSFTEAVDANSKVSAVDPYIKEGVSEADITAVLLSECSNVSESLELLKHLIETEGMNSEGFAILLCDQNEQWYVEALASHYFLAIPLSDNLAFVNVDVSLLGLIDLDDENIICTDGLIELAKQAGTFIGDEEKNIIDYRRSIGDYRVDLFGDGWKWSVFTRNAVSLNKLLNTDEFNADNVIEDNDYVITNISEDGSIVPFYNKLELKDTVTLDYVIELLRLYPIGSTQNIETHIYRFYPDVEPDFGTVEYSSFASNQCNVFIPGYPMLMTDTWDGYKVGLLPTSYEAEDPENWDLLEEQLESVVEPLKEGILDTNDYYTMPGVNYVGYEFLDCTDVYHIFPEGWDKSYSYTYNALTNYLYYLGSDEEKELSLRYCDDMQQEFNARFKELSADLKKETDHSKRQEMMTLEHASMSRKSQETALALYRHFNYGEELPDSSDDHGFSLKYVVMALCGALVLFGIIYIYIKKRHGAIRAN